MANERLPGAKGSGLTARGKAILSAVIALLTFLCFFFLFRGLPRYWDAVWMFIFGIGIGGRAGDWLADRISAGRWSEGPALVLMNFALAVMATVWWCSTPETTSFIASWCRGLSGAWTGAFVVEILTMEPYRKHAHQGGEPSDA
jgi:hypothetical protein